MSTGIAAIVVQLGLATMPLGMSSRSSGLTSDTTSGTSGSLRQALELSTTTAPASATRGAQILEVDPPLENSAMSSPEKSAVAVSSTVTSVSPHGRVVPAERADAKYRISSTGKFRSKSRVRMTLPTWPVAPKTPIRMSTSLESGPDAGRRAHDAGAGRAGRRLHQVR